MKSKLSFVLYLFLIVGLFLYSYTQIDLSLTFSRWSVWQVIEKSFQHVGYFQRPLSTLLYIVIISLMFIFYILFLIMAYRKKITAGYVWILIIATTIILTFSYNAFSYDLFNYIFDAKIITHYFQNPYFHNALDYPNDPMLSFMHWTQRNYPYGPTWLLLTVPLSFIGLNIFVPTFFLFKILASIGFLGIIFFLSKIMEKLSPKRKTLSLVFFGLNPLVIIESLVSAHNDVAMMALMMWAFYLFIEDKYLGFMITFILSVGVKFATLVTSPVFAILYFLKKNKININWNLSILSMIGLSVIAIILATLRTNFQPWYLLYTLPLASLIPDKYYIFIPVIIISFFSSLQYVPFLFLGNWNNPVPMILSNLMWMSMFSSVILVVIWFIINKRFVK